MLLPRNLELLSKTLRGPFVPLVCGFIGRDNLQAWRDLIRNNVAHDFRNTSTLREFIGYADSTDFREISPENKFNRRTLGRFTPYRLLTHPEGKYP